MSSNSGEVTLPNLIAYATIIVRAYIGNNRVSASEVVSLVKDVHTTLAGLVPPGGEHATIAQKPAVPIKKSIAPDSVICLEDGKKLKMLKRHLRTHHRLTTDEYRAKWSLPADYPMVAPNYAARRSEFAKKIGLGRKQRTPKKRKRG
jgi:predicted transcriptional regulator